MAKHIRPKKWLGQHFLADTSISAKIAALAPADGNGAALVEVGPGEGALTKHLPTVGYRDIYLLDVDAESIEVLMTKFHNPPYHVRLADFLETDFTSFGRGDVVVVGNFPYNISSQIFFKILAETGTVTTVVCMVQKEVAKRIASKPGNKEYGILSVLLQLWFDISYAFTVKPGSFIPPPKVDSGVIVLKRHNRHVTELGVPMPFFTRVVKAAFNQRRKMLRNALAGITENLPDDAPHLDQRAEQLSVKEFMSLAKFMYPYRKMGNALQEVEMPTPDPDDYE